MIFLSEKIEFGQHIPNVGPTLVDICIKKLIAQLCVSGQ